MDGVGGGEVVGFVWFRLDVVVSVGWVGLIGFLLLWDICCVSQQDVQ